MITITDVIRYIYIYIRWFFNCMFYYIYMCVFVYICFFSPQLVTFPWKRWDFSQPTTQVLGQVFRWSIRCVFFAMGPWAIGTDTLPFNIHSNGKSTILIWHIGDFFRDLSLRQERAGFFRISLSL